MASHKYVDDEDFAGESDAAIIEALDRYLASGDEPQEAVAYAPPAVQPAAPTRTRKVIKKPTRQKRVEEYTLNSQTGEFELENPPRPVRLPQPEIRGFVD